MIRGCLWKPGVNGLGVRGMNHLPYRVLFDYAARVHDTCYDIGGNSQDRRMDDLLFLSNELNACSTPMQYMFAWFYYIIVRLFGWLFYRYEGH